MAKDPVCGMQVNEREAKATTEHKGRTFHFCSTECKQTFDRNPDQYARQTA
jgi:YHS domain-containing protein